MSDQKIDWYRVAFGVAAPGVAPPRTLAPALPDEVSGDVVATRRARRRDEVASRTSPSATRARGGPLPPQWAQDARGPRRGQEGGAPLSAIQGRDTRPFGEDFATWYQAITSPRQPQLTLAQSAPEGDEFRSPMGDIPDLRASDHGTDPASAVSAIDPAYERGRPRPFAQAHYQSQGNLRTTPNEAVRFDPVVEAPQGGPLYDPARRAGIIPEFDPTAEWAAAEERAGASGATPPVQRTWMDPLFAAVFGRRGGR